MRSEVRSTEIVKDVAEVSVMSESVLEPKPTPLEKVAVVAETMERETKKTCCELKEDTRKICHCCIRSWSLCLNGCECTCGLLSKCCIGMSNMTIAFKNCLEYIDCDGH